MPAFIDRTGQRFGRLVAVEYLGRSKWRCKCDCGGETIATGTNLKNGNTRSCGCLQRDIVRSHHSDLVGKRFGKLVVTEYLGNKMWRCVCDCGNITEESTKRLQKYAVPSCGCEVEKRHEKANLLGKRFGRLLVTEKIEPGRWKCKCDCGNETIVRAGGLTSGKTRSCGCLKDELASERLTTHGETGSRLYYVWTGMKQRCTNPNHKSYESYGGRGITVCDEWLHDYEAFRKWAIESGYDETAPTHQCSIDRIDNDKGYSPDNCRWATASEQRVNSRKRQVPSLYVPVNALDLDGNLIKQYPGISRAAEDVGCLVSGIIAACIGKQKTCHGMRWEYAEKA